MGLNQLLILLGLRLLVLLFFVVMLLGKDVSFREVLHVSDELGFVCLVDLVQSEDVFFKLLFKKLQIYFLFGVEILRSWLFRLDLVLVL